MIDTLLHTLFALLGENRLSYHTVLAFIIGILVITAAKIVKWFLNSVGRKIIAKTDTEIADEILEIILSRIIALSSVVGIYFGMKELRLGLTKQDEIFLTFLGYADTALYIVTVIIVAVVSIRIARTISTHTIRSLAEKHKHDDVNYTLAPLVNRVLTFIIVAFTAIVVLEHFGQNISSVLTILGVGSLALGLAAQDTLTNMISGFIIMIDRPFRVGDRVKIPSGEVGDVYEIGLRSTKILDFDSNVLIVPNNELVKTRIVNYSYPQNEIRVVVEVAVAYGSDVNQVKNILLTIARSHPEVLSDPAPEVFLMKLGDVGLNFSLFCHVADFKIQFKTAETIRVQLYAALNKAKIKISFPQQVGQHKYESSNAVQTSSKRKKISR